MARNQQAVAAQQRRIQALEKELQSLRRLFGLTDMVLVRNLAVPLRGLQGTSSTKMMSACLASAKK